MGNDAASWSALDLFLEEDGETFIKIQIYKSSIRHLLSRKCDIHPKDLHVLMSHTDIAQQLTKLKNDKYKEMLTAGTTTKSNRLRGAMKKYFKNKLQLPSTLTITAPTIENVDVLKMIVLTTPPSGKGRFLAIEMNNANVTDPVHCGLP